MTGSIVCISITCVRACVCNILYEYVHCIPVCIRRSFLHIPQQSLSLLDLSTNAQAPANSQFLSDFHVASWHSVKLTFVDNRKVG
ncbi:expressed protein [Phakopsora pachyrhizi]|uniref:Expressed protein n=1 Tax=Phakopsora pachyrhizi TaxID=170000 RepID=A0AAV0BB66_PHAPC|nr:expressed protein [Phakopsora pachyrhizi]CAH7682345.1 expressed protein [Phakopsora pachyrhizi]